MNNIILDQIGGIYHLYKDGIINATEARKSMVNTVKYYFGNIADYIDFINSLYDDATK